MTRALAILSPILFACLVVGLLWISEYHWATTVIRVKLEVLVLSIGVCFSFILSLLRFNKYRVNRITTKLKQELFLASDDEHKRFVQRLDHELKNPLTAIQLGLENLKQQSSNISAQTIHDLQTQAHRLSQLTGDLRKLAVFDEQELELERVDIAELLTETMELVIDETHRRNVELALPAAPWPVPNVVADRDLLQLALYNVIENAVKYSAEDDHVAIRANDDKGFVKIEIADTGIGIPPGDINKVWGELFRGTNGHDRKGTGIGLSLVKRIIERHNGEVNVQSKLNKGTRVTFSLPITS